MRERTHRFLEKVMTRWRTVFLVCVLALSALTSADAKRLGGGISVGKQQPAAVARPTVSGTAPAAQPAPGAAAVPAVADRATGSANPAAVAPAVTTPVPQPPSGARPRWLAPLAGIAAGIGVAALLEHFGLAGGALDLLSSLAIVALFVFAGLAVWRFLRMRAAPVRPQPAYAERIMGPNTVSDLGREGMVNPQPSAPLRLDSTLHPGNGLRPLAPAAAFGIPEDFNVDVFMRNAKVYFVRLQAAWDAGNLNDIREFTTPEMFSEIRKQLEDRGPTPNQTDVVALNAQVLGVTTASNEYMASVRFHGMLREQIGGAAEDFDEVWNLTKPVQGTGGWVLAGVQQIEAVTGVEL